MEENSLSEIVAANILEIHDSVERLLAGPLNENAVVLLIHDALPSKVGITKTQIRQVLAAIKDLKKKHIKSSATRGPWWNERF